MRTRAGSRMMEGDESDDQEEFHSAGAMPEEDEEAGPEAVLLVGDADNNENPATGAQEMEEEEEDEDYEWDEEGEGSGEEESEDDAEVFFFSSNAPRGAYAQLLRNMPRLDEYVPPTLDHELADELSLRTSAVGLRDGQQRCASVMSPAKSLMLRETGPSSGRAARHIATNHRLPTKPTRVVERMHSRAYVGRFTADGELFVAAFQNERRIRMYDVQNGWCLAKDVHARNLRWTVTDTALSADQRFLLYASITPIVHLVNVERGAGGTGATHSIANVTDIHEALNFSDETRANGIWSLRWSHDDREIIAGTGDASLYIYEVAAGRSVVRVQGHRDDVNAVVYAGDDDGNVIVTGSDDHTIKVWDRRTLGQRRGSAVGAFIGHNEGVAHLDAKGDGRYIISNSKDQTVKLWDVRKMRSPREVTAAAGGGLSFQWDYRWMPYPAAGHVVQHPNDGAIATFRGHSVLSTLCRAYWSPAATTGQRYIYAASACGAVVIWDVISGAEVARLEYHKEIVRDCSWHPHLPLLATASFDGTICTWEPDVPGEAEAEAEQSKALPRPGRDQLSDWG